MKELILGGVRSGKSRLAQQLAIESGLAVVFIATATAEDPEMQRRIAEHKRRRPSSWTLVEEPHRLAHILREHARAERCVLVDCLTLWLNNLLFADQHAYPDTGPITPPAAWSAEIEALLTALPLKPKRRDKSVKLGLPRLRPIPSTRGCSVRPKTSWTGWKRARFVWCRCKAR